MTQPLKFHLQVAPSSTRVRPGTAGVGVRPGTAGSGVQTQPRKFHLQVAPSSTSVRPVPVGFGVQTNPLSRVIIAATEGRRGPAGLPGDGTPIIGETPAGVKNGVNTVFTTAFAFSAGTTAVYLNGLREFYYTETGVGEITLEDAPDPTDTLCVDYVI